MQNIMYCENKDYFRNQSLFKTEKCPDDLRFFLKDLFKAFHLAKFKYNAILAQFAPMSVVHKNNADCITWAMREAVQQVFKNEWCFLPYKKFVLYLHGYVIFFHKFGKNGLPSQKQINKILERKKNELQSFFPQNDNGSCTVLIFGYMDSCIGDFANPQIICLDYCGIQWRITESELNDDINSPSLESSMSIPDREVHLRPSGQIGSMNREF